MDTSAESSFVAIQVFVRRVVADGLASPVTGLQALMVIQRVIDALPDLPPPRVAPGPDGMVGITWESAGHHVNVEVFQGGRLELFAEHSDPPSLWDSDSHVELLVGDALLDLCGHLNPVRAGHALAQAT